MLICPICSSSKVHRSHTRFPWESARRKLTGKRPYRCRQCGWRGWDHEIGPGSGEFEIAADSASNMPGHTLQTRERIERLSEFDLDRIDGLGRLSDKAKS